MKNRFSKTVIGKLLGSLFFIIMLSVTIATIFALAFTINWNFYGSNHEDARRNMLELPAHNDAHRIAYDYENESNTPRLKNQNVNYKLYDHDDKLLASSESFPEHYIYYFYDEYFMMDYSDGEQAYYTIELFVDTEFPYQDEYYIQNIFVMWLYPMRYWLIAIMLLSAILTLALFVQQMIVAGRNSKDNEVKQNSFDKIPFDLFVVIMSIVISAPLIVVIESSYSYYASDIVFLVLYILLFVFETIVGLLTCKSIAVRIKSKTIFKNTITYKLFSKMFDFCGRVFKLAMEHLPLTWKAFAILGAVTFAEVIVILLVFASEEISFLIFFWLVEKIAIALGLLYLVVTLLKLKQSGKALADGDLTHTTDTTKMHYDFKEHGENLNSIAVGINKAVEARLKSERMRTELIANVSHDIKTPLTSILNYTDLLSREQLDNENATKYIDIILKQSERLKKLTEDVMEASKITSGNIEVNLTDCEVGVLFSQVQAEYEERLKLGSITLITTSLDSPTFITADSRLMWRVFDNLLGNIAKYAQPDTRAYITAEVYGEYVQISLKNTSKFQLNISSDELMERFIRGDTSRTTEGNGLGLSISQSLIKLQNGTFDLTIDGDLFKVSITLKQSGYSA